MSPQRFLCSHLVAIDDRIVNLEEIWTTGAILEAETAVTRGTQLELRCGAVVLKGRIVEVEPHEFGCRFEVEFSPDTPWRLDDFRPDHLLDPSKLGRDGGELLH
jgi:hypothetical protein